MTQTKFFSDLPQDGGYAKGPVTCLGLTFESDEARRAHFTEELRKKLQDPEFRKIEGFPTGSDEDILNLSDPPYYTACPNPWFADFIRLWEAEKSERTEENSENTQSSSLSHPHSSYHREPFAADVSEGKNDPIYNAHSYHTKVPHKAIMRYILHYTEPGAIVFDGFCGTGMTGVAAQMCGDREVVMSLGYQVKQDGAILQEETDENGKKTWRAFSKLGVRRAVLNDLSPAATFIAYNYNTPVDVAAFEMESKRILTEVEDECGWMYETLHPDGSICKVDYVVWSEVFTCPSCATQLVFSEIALEDGTGKVRKELICPYCNSELKKNDLELVYEENWDPLLQQSKRLPKRVPYLIAYKKGKDKYSKRPDSYDLDVIEKVSQLPFPDFPVIEMPDMQMMRVGRMKPSNVTHLHHFFLKRPLITLRSFWLKASQIKDSNLRSKALFFVEQSVWGLSILARYTPTHFSQVNQYLSGVFYMASHIVDVSPNYILGGKLKRLLKVFASLCVAREVVTTATQDTANIQLPDNSLDYAFVDPPFGENIYYSDLNLLIESLHGVVTNTDDEAIIDRVKGKEFSDYQRLMSGCFQCVYNALKPGRWMTVEFSNSNASIWNLIQTSLGEAGFVVSNVSVLDKKQRSFQSVVSPTAVKQDLVISAYKPNGGFEERFEQEAQTEEGVWDFVRTHLNYLPVIKRQGALLQFIPERDPRILFDQMVAYYVRKGYPVPVSSQEFQVDLAQRFIERDGMYFLSDQVAEYDRKKMAAGGLNETVEMFVKDEASMIQWLRQLIKLKPQTFSDINPQFMQQLGGWSKNEAQLDLRELLNQNFLSYDGKGLVPEQIHTYLSSNWKELRKLPKDSPALVAKAQDRWYVPDPNKAGDLEKLREKSLIKEFDEYKQVKKKLKVFRLEAVRAGFKKAWQERNYAAIISVADKIPNKILEEDPKLLMWYDQAVTRMGGE